MNDLETADPQNPHPISIEFFSRQSNKTTQLINNKNEDFAVDGKNRWFSYEFEVPVYVKDIKIESSGYDRWKDVEFDVEHLDGTTHNEKISLSDGVTNLTIGKLAKRFQFRPDSQWFPASPKILRVVVQGLTLEEFHAYEWAIKEYEARKRKVERLEEGVADLTTREQELQDRAKSLEAEIGQSEGQIAVLVKEIDTRKNALSEQESAQDDLASDIEDKRAARRTLQSEITEAESKLESVTREVRLFPSEIAGFVREGNRSTIQYILLGIPFVFILMYVTYALFSSAIDLTQLWKKQENIDIWTVFLTRLPFVLVAITILEVCGYIIGRFVFEILKINRQRLSLSKLSIIAKDVSTASSHQLELTPEEAFDHETKLKMELLREHMKEEIGEDFVYKGTAIQSAIKAVATRVSAPKSSDG